MSAIYLFSLSKHSDAINISALDITFLQPAIDFSKYDGLLLTSKQSSKALLYYDKESYIHLPALCISGATAQSYRELGGEVLDIAKGYGDTLVTKIQNYPKERKWLYLRAKVVASDFVSLCQKDGYCIDEKIVYESSCSQAIQNVEISSCATLIFTSPSSLHCFLKKHTFTKNHKVIVIGKTTAKAVPNGVEYFISRETTVESCMEIANFLSFEYNNASEQFVSTHNAGST